MNVKKVSEVRERRPEFLHSVFTGHLLGVWDTSENKDFYTLTFSWERRQKKNRIVLKYCGGKKKKKH